MPSFDSSFDSSADASAELSAFEEICALLLAPAQDLENTMIAVRDENVDTAIGVRLDPYGRLVGLLRSASPLFSTDDDAYRRGIRSQIAVNHSAGRRDQLIRIAKLVVNDTAAKIFMQRQATATVFCRIDRVAISSSTMSVLVRQLGLAVSNGVRVLVQTSPSAPSSTLIYNSGPGFGTTTDPAIGGLLADIREGTD